MYCNAFLILVNVEGVSMNHRKHSVICILTLLLIAVIAVISLMCAVPPVSRDALTHHLAVPKLYLSHGGIYEIPSIVFSYYPMILEDLLYLPALYLGSDIVPKYIHFAFALLTALLIYRYLKNELGVHYGLLGALFFITIPIIVKLSITVYVDLGLIFFSFATILSLLSWIKNDFKWRYLFLSAVCCGLALSTKYNGLITFFCLAMFVPLIVVRCGAFANKPQGRPLISMAAYIVVALLVFSPWMVKDYMWTGNPIYPLYNNWFNSESVQHSDTSLASTQNPKKENSATQKKKIHWNHFMVRKVVYHESALETLLIPLRVFFQGQDDNPKYFDGKLNPFLLFLPLLSLIGLPSETRERKRDSLILLSFAILYLLLVYIQIDMRIRWIAPIIPPLVILAMFGVRRLELLFKRQHKSIGKFLFGGFAIAAAALPIGYNAKYIYNEFQYVKPLPYIDGNVSRSEYIARYRPEYPVIARANSVLPSDAKILALYLGNRTYYSDHAMDCNDSIFFNQLQLVKSAKELCLRLSKRGFTHILMRFDLLQQRINTRLSTTEKEVLKNFFQNYLREVYVKNGYGLFAIRRSYPDCKNR